MSRFSFQCDLSNFVPVATWSFLLATLVLIFEPCRFVHAQARSQTSDASQQASDEAAARWTEGSMLKGKVVDHQGQPVANAEVILLGDKHIVVDAHTTGDSRMPTWQGSASNKSKELPPSTHTNGNGEFSLECKAGSANRLAIVATDPLFWIVKRSDLAPSGNVEIKLPASGSVAIHCDLPGKNAKQQLELDLRTFDGMEWIRDWFRFAPVDASVANPGEVVFEHLPPARYSISRAVAVPTQGGQPRTMWSDRQLFTVESGQQATISIDRKVGRPLTGHIKGLDNANLRYSQMTITYMGPKEMMGSDGRMFGMLTVFDTMAINSSGDFTTDPIPPGTYAVSYLGVKADNSDPRGADLSDSTQITIPVTGDMPKLEMTAAASSVHQLVLNRDNVRLHVIDEKGTPLAKFEGLVSFLGTTRGWSPGADGAVSLPGPIYPTADIVVRADGYASVVKKFDGEEREKLLRGDASITLSRGNKAKLHFQLPTGMSWPTGTVPDVYFEHCLESYLMQQLNRVNLRGALGARENPARMDFNLLNAQPDGVGDFSFQLPSDSEPFFVGIQAPGFIQYFDAGPFTAKDVKDGVLTVDVPKPGSLEISFDVGTADATSRPFTRAVVEISRQFPGVSYYRYLSAKTDYLDGKPVQFLDLPPAKYGISLRTAARNSNLNPRDGEGVDPARFSDHQQIDVQSDHVEHVKFEYHPFDGQAFRGNRTAVINIQNADGHPAGGRTLKVDYDYLHYGMLPVYTGVTSESGEVTLNELTDATSVGEKHATYTVSVDKKALGTFSFSGSEGAENFEFRLPPQVGDPAPDIEFTNLADGKTMKLSDLRGKVVLLDFWATWCGPCQPALEKLDKDVADHADDWKDKLAVIPISIDDEAGTAKPHFEKKGWTHLDTYWTGKEDKVGWQAPALQAFKFSSIPHGVLIDREGKIVWMGHPLTDIDGKDLADRVDDLLKQ